MSCGLIHVDDRFSTAGQRQNLRARKYFIAKGLLFRKIGGKE
jgi:hypothetical protein